MQAKEGVERKSDGGANTKFKSELIGGKHFQYTALGVPAIVLTATIEKDHPMGLLRKKKHKKYRLLERLGHKFHASEVAAAA